MVDSAILKIEKATEHIDNLDKLFREKRPFTYVLEGNAKTGERATYAKKNEAVINSAVLTCGDAIHNLRTALDHAYWEIVAPFAPMGNGATSVQFPFSETEARLDETIKNRLAHRVSDAFFQTLRGLRPHGEPGGNELLFLIHKLDTVDKHKVLIPTADYTRLSSEVVRAQVPDFPKGLVNFTVGINRRDVAWHVAPMFRIARRRANLPSSGIFEKELDVPVDMVFAVGASPRFRPMVPTLYRFIDVAKETIRVIRASSKP